MKLYHITSAVAASLIAREGFNGRTQERSDALPPWVSRRLLGQQGLDAVSMTFGGLPSVPWKKMVMHGQALREEDLASVEIEVTEREVTRVFASLAISTTLWGKTLHGVSLEVTAPRELVNQRIVGVRKGPPPTTGGLAGAADGWRKAFSIAQAVTALTDGLRPEVQATLLIAMWTEMGVPERRNIAASIVEADLRLRRAAFKLAGVEADLLPAQKEMLKKWGINP
jgi:hypothetical protein